MKFGLKKSLISALFCFLLSAVSSFSLAADHVQTVIFQIGKFDRSSAEFASGEPKKNVDFVISQSNPAKDWYGWQPALQPSQTKPGSTGLAAAPRAIEFSLADAPAGRYRLHVALLVESASVPHLQVDINGKLGAFPLHPRLDYSNGDQGDCFYPAYSSADVEFEFPASYLKKGTNRITLQMVEEAPEHVPDAGLVYDAIALASIGSSSSRLVSAQIDPTVFYQQQKGDLLETVDAFVRHVGRIAPGTKADLTVAGRTYTAGVKSDFDFGEEKIEFAVGDFPAGSMARLVMPVAGHTEHFDQSISPAKKWTIYIVPHIHVDVGYSDYQAKISAIQARTIDEAMDMLAKNPDFRFSLDGEWDLEQFLATRSAAQKERAMHAIEDKKLFVPAQYFNLLTGIPTTETLIRSLYPSADLAREHGTPFDYANITDVPSYSWSYASILASAGVHYLAGGSNNYRAPVLLQGRLNEHSPMWWVGPDGQKVLLWYSRIYQQMQALFGLPPVIAAGRETVPLFLQMYEGPDYHANATMMYGTQVENTDLFAQQSDLASKWNGMYAYPRFQYAGFHDALTDIEKQFGDSIPTIRGDGGPYWEDGAGSDAHYLAIERRAEPRGQTAEKLATLALLVNPHLAPDTARIDDMWREMLLMDEHTWDSYNSVSDPGSMEARDQLAIKDQYAVNAAAQVDFIARRGLASLANAIPAGPGSLIVFNSLNWQRSGPVFVDLDKDQEIVDLLSNQPAPFEVLSSGPDYVHVRFTANNVPALGYKVYSLRHVEHPTPPSETEQNASLENDHYKVALDAESGAIRSIYDKQLNRDIVNSDSPYRFGQFLYVTGGDKAPNTLLQYSHVYPKADIEVHPAHNGRLISIKRTPEGEVATLESEDVNTPSITTEIRLFDHEKKIEITEKIDKKEVYTKEAAYFAFPFAAVRPRFQYEIQNGVVDPAKDMYAGAGHEWFTAQHWVSVEQDGFSGSVLPLDAPLVTLGDINRGEWPEQFGNRTGTIFSYIMNNYWDTNYRAGQGGRFTFRYVITSADSTRANDLSRLGWEEATPLEADIVTTQDKAFGPSGESDPASQPPAGGSSSASLDGKQGSFLEISDPNVLVETWKAAEDGNGTILRFLDFGGTERTVSVTIPQFHLEHAWQTDAVERGETPLATEGSRQFSFTLHPHEIVTVRIEGARQ